MNADETPEVIGLTAELLVTYDTLTLLVERLGLPALHMGKDGQPTPPQQVCDQIEATLAVAEDRLMPAAWHLLLDQALGQWVAAFHLITMQMAVREAEPRMHASVMRALASCVRLAEATTNALVKLAAR